MNKVVGGCGLKGRHQEPILWFEGERSNGMDVRRVG